MQVKSILRVESFGGTLFDIKSGKIDPYLGLELFILNLKECQN